MTKLRAAVGICLALPMCVAAAARMEALGGTLHPESWFVIDCMLLPAAAVLALVSLGMLIHAFIKHPRERRRLVPWAVSALAPWSMLILFQALWQYSRG